VGVCALYHRRVTKRDERPWRVDLSESILDGFQASVDRLGMTQKEATRRLLMWFATQDVDVQALIMQQLSPERTAELARIILRDMGKRK
jgi:hypothetical protein